MTSVVCTDLTAFGLYFTTSVKILPYSPPARLIRAKNYGSPLQSRFKTTSFLCFFHSSNTFKTHAHFRRQASDTQLLSNFSHSEAAITGAQPKAGTGHKMQTVSVVFSTLHCEGYTIDLRYIACSLLLGVLAGSLKSHPPF